MLSRRRRPSSLRLVWATPTPRGSTPPQGLSIRNLVIVPPANTSLVKTFILTWDNLNKPLSLKSSTEYPWGTTPRGKCLVGSLPVWGMGRPMCYDASRYEKITWNQMTFGKLTSWCKKRGLEIVCQPFAWKLLKEQKDLNFKLDFLHIIRQGWKIISYALFFVGARSKKKITVSLCYHLIDVNPCCTPSTAKFFVW